MKPKKSPDTVCPKFRHDSCPAGHTLTKCDQGDHYYCKQCSDTTFQPNENWVGDQCRLRKDCNSRNMRYFETGSTVRDAKCVCRSGYHFPNEDERACVPNKSCPKGKAHGEFGNCESCLQKSMYSDVAGRATKCKPLTNCEKQNRCTITKSNGKHDNICGYVVSDLSTCEQLNPNSSSSANSTTTYVIAGTIGSFVFLSIIISIILFFFYNRRRKPPSGGTRALAMEELGELRVKILKECDRDPAFCKHLLTTSFSFVEERIDRQIWTLAQELFRSHPKQGQYELIVDRYKNSQAKYTVNGYLQEWRLWKGDSKDSLADLFKCLCTVQREDIVNEIAMCLRADVDFHPSSDSNYPQHKDSLVDECCYIFFPCTRKEKSVATHSSAVATGAVVVEHEAGEAGTKLLANATDDLDDDNGEGGDGITTLPPPGTFCPAHPSPSAPEFEEMGGGRMHEMDTVKFSRQFSQPVQATS